MSLGEELDLIDAGLGELRRLAHKARRLAHCSQSHRLVDDCERELAQMELSLRMARHWGHDKRQRWLEKVCS